MKKAVVLLSSGLDSAANLALGQFAGFEVVSALTINYGQRAAANEIQYASRLASHFKIEHHVFGIPHFAEMVSKSSALLGKGVVPSPNDLDDLKEIRETAKAVWVPNRNGVMVELAAAFAESNGLDAVVVGFNKEEATTFPDNSKEYIDALNAALKFSTANGVEVMSATVNFTKVEIVKRLAELNFPFEKIWSCYHEDDIQCGECESCKRLRRALETGLPSDRVKETLSKVFYL